MNILEPVVPSYSSHILKLARISRVSSKRSNPNVTLVTVAGGDHYNSMINEGIPAAIRWAKTLTAYTAAPKP